MNSSAIPLWLRASRHSLWLAIALVLLVVLAIISPVQLPVLAYKAAQIALAAVLGYWLDRALFPYARPDGYLDRDWRLGTTAPEGDADFPIVPDYQTPFCIAMLRRAIVIAAVVIGVALGL